MNRAKDNRGFTLMEMVVVLAVIAILAAVLTPIINSYIDRARFNAAQSDVKNIAAAIVQFNTDTRLWPIYSEGSFEGLNDDKYDVLYTTGNEPDTTLWTFTSSTSLDLILNQNAMVLPVTGSTAWRGAYLQLAPDAWGSRYYVTAANLAPGSTNAAFVVSAGPDQAIDTAMNQARGGTLAVGGDDIVQRIR